MRSFDNRAYRADVTRIAESPVAWELIDNATIVLSGASGMIGSCLVDVLMARVAEHGANCTIHALARDPAKLRDRFSAYADSPNLVLTSVDVSQGLGATPGDLALVDYVVHAASQTHPAAYSADPIGTIMTNVDGTRHLLDLAVRAKARRVVFLSSVEIYGDNREPSPRPFAETDAGYIDCNTVRAGYPESKRAGEALCQGFRAQYGLDFVTMRLPRVYGPTLRPDDTKALSQFLFRAAVGQDVELKSAGRQLFSYCHVADAVSAILVGLSRGVPGAAYNVADPSSDIRLCDLAHLVADAAGTQVVQGIGDPAEQRGYSAASVAVMDATRLASLGWAPHYTIDLGVRQTLAVLTEATAPQGAV